MATEPEELYRSLLDAWNAQDAEVMAALFAQDGEMIGFDGSNVRGRTYIARHLGTVFGDHTPAKFVAKVTDTVELAEGVSLLRAKAGMVPPGGSDINPDVNTHHTLIVRRSDDGWHVVLFQNTPAQFHGRPELVEKFTNELRELL